MSEEIQYTVLALSIEAALLPEWFEEVKKVAAKHVRRMGVVEKPDEWIVQCELPKDGVGAFQQDLQEAWAAFSG